MAVHKIEVEGVVLATESRSPYIVVCKERNGMVRIGGYAKDPDGAAKKAVTLTRRDRHGHVVVTITENIGAEI